MTTISRLARQTRLGRYLSTRTGRRTVTFYVFISPWLLGFIFLNVIPLAAGILMSFTNYDGLNPTGFKFVGLTNYAKLLGDTFAHKTFERTLAWTVLFVPSSMALSFALAMVLHARVARRTH